MSKPRERKPTPATAVTPFRMGLIGPAGDAKAELERAIDQLLADPNVRRILYLGADGAIERVAAAFARTRLEQDEFLRRAAELACAGSPDEIAELLAEERASSRLSLVRKLPEPPARAIEMLDKWIVLAVHDKAVLDEDDIANAHIIVYGRAEESVLKRFGPRCFFAPGPLAAGKLGCLDLMPDGHVELHLLGLDGAPLETETLHGQSAKLVVTS